jgi:hypothetical protein
MNAQFATEGQAPFKAPKIKASNDGMTMEQMQQAVQSEINHPHNMPLRGRVSSLHRLHRAERKFLKEEQKDLKKVHRYHLKINKGLAMTINAVEKARKIVQRKSVIIAARLAKYGTRKLNHLYSLYKMAENPLLQERLKPIILSLKRKIIHREQEMKKSVAKIVASMNSILALTMKQLVYAKLVSDTNNKAAKKNIRAIGEYMAQGLKQGEGKRQIGTKDLRMLKHKVVHAERKIAHQLHLANRRELHILKNARKLLKQLRIKTKHIVVQLKHKTRSEYRHIYREHSKKMVQILLHQENLPEKYEY